jgi:hypothetical protein
MDEPNSPTRQTPPFFQHGKAMRYHYQFSLMITKKKIRFGIEKKKKNHNFVRFFW